jgi:hypothetical protein
MDRRSAFLRTAIAAAFASAGLAGCAMMGMGNTDTYEANLSAAQEVPPASSPGNGSAEVRYNRDTSMLSWRVTYGGLTGPATAGHIHGPALPGANAGVVVPFPNAASANPITGEARITAEQLAQLNAGQWYVNIHTARFPGGEIRGQLRRR